MAKKKQQKENELVDEIKSEPNMGFEFKENFSPCVSLDGMQKRMEERIKKVRKMKNNNIFVNPFQNTKK